MLTPGQKIKAMLARFDSDSETENTTTASKTDRIAPPNFAAGVSKNIASALDEDEDEDVTVLAPRGRMAARMQGLENTETAYDRVAKTLHVPSADATPNNAQSSNEDQSSEDDMPTAVPTRRRLLNAKEHELNTTKYNEPSNRHARSESPLFVEEDSGSEPRAEKNASAEEPKDARFLALVERKRKERQEREKIEAEKRAARAEKMKEFNSDIVDDESDEDPESAKQLTQTSRPARKASKKALEEMARETQRMSRNRQLAYQPRVKRKITIDSFVALMNSHKIEQPSEPIDSASSSSAPSSDADGNKQKETPPTSPTSPAAPTFDEQKSVQDQPSKLPQTAITKAPKVAESRVRVRLSREEVAKRQNEEPDDDLEIITSPTKCRKAAIFENVRSKNLTEHQTMLRLKLLARLTSPTSRTKSMSPAELSAMLQLKARQQALRERQERIEELRAQGIVIETAEEREAMEADVEDLMEKARQEADLIARREKAAREKKSGVSSAVSDDEEEDDDYELSGSEDEEGGMDEDIESDGEGEGSEEELEEEMEVETDHPVQKLVDNEADDGSEEEEEPELSSHEDEKTLTHGTRGRRQRRVVSDDEEEDEANEVQSTKAVPEPKTPARSVAASIGSAQRPQFPNMPGASTFTMSLTQAFAGTIAEDQLDGEEDSFKVLQSLPDPGLPNLQQMAIDSQVMVKDSQDQRRGSIDLFAGYTQSGSRVPESPGHNWSQYSQMPEPTQDVGFVYSPIDVSKRFVEPPVSTVDTVILPESESPVIRKKGRLLQRGRPVHLSDDEAGDFEIKASAFDVMKKASKQKTKTVAVFDKSNSKAKEHVDEAAEESEDEYAGLGGASDDDNGEEDELDREMINDNSGEVVDEKELAALNA